MDKVKSDKIQSLKIKKSKARKKIWARVVSLSEAGQRMWDIEFWQSQSSILRFRVAFDMLSDFYKLKRKRINAHTFRLQRSIENLKQT
ncbi:MAG: hypothetical protein J7K37_01360 [Candidatus Omnitrophica bacterium]|nr:hypothetical protein [Candidatus Omnitrophota bacterium]